MRKIIKEELVTLTQDSGSRNGFKKLTIKLEEDIILTLAKKMFPKHVKEWKDISKLGTVDYDKLIKTLLKRICVHKNQTFSNPY